MYLYPQGSYKDFLTQLQGVVMPQLLHEIEATYPGSRYGLAGFSDYYELGFNSLYSYTRDYCYKYYHGLSTNQTSFMNTLKSIKISYGADIPESSLQAIAMTIMDSRFGWYQTQETSDKKRIIKVIALATDAASHEAGFMANKERYRFPAFTYTPSDTCMKDSPTAEGVGRLLQSNDIFFLGLISTRFMLLTKLILIISIEYIFRRCAPNVGWILPSNGWSRNDYEFVIRQCV